MYPSGKLTYSDCWNIPPFLIGFLHPTQSGSIFQPAYVRLPISVSPIFLSFSILGVQFSTEPLWEKGLVVRNQLLLDPVFEFKNITTSSRRSLGWRSRFPVPGRVGSRVVPEIPRKDPKKGHGIFSRRIACGSFMGVFCWGKKIETRRFLGQKETLLKTNKSPSPFLKALFK